MVLKVLNVVNFEYCQKEGRWQFALHVLSIYLKARHHQGALHPGRCAVHSNKILISHRFLIHSDYNCCLRCAAIILYKLTLKIIVCKP